MKKVWFPRFKRWLYTSLKTPSLCSLDVEKEKKVYFLQECVVDIDEEEERRLLSICFVLWL